MSRISSSSFRVWSSASIAHPVVARLNRLCVNRDENLMPHDDTPACERAVPTHAEVVTVDMGRGRKACPDLGTLIDPILPPRRLPLAQVADVQHHRFGDTSDGEVAGDKGLIRTHHADGGAREPDL